MDALSSILARPRVQYATRDPSVGRRYSATLMRRPELRPAQVSGLLAMEDTASAGDGLSGPRGFVGMLGCGHGKTLLAQLAPYVYRTPHYLIFEPAALRTQFLREADVWRRYYRIPEDTADRFASYEHLSQPHMKDALTNCAPDLLIFDEAHLLGNPDSARWRRVARYLESRPQCRVVVLSGTMTSASINQMAHLLFASLRDWSPIPNDGTEAVWSTVMDLGTSPAPQDIHYMAPLATWAGEPGSDIQAIRRGFATRVRTSRGVVVSHGMSADVSLRGRLWRGPPRPPAVEAATVALEHDWKLPDGTELVEALEMDRHSRTIALGFYARWVPDTGHPDWFPCRKEWNKCVRDRVSYGGFDSPALVETAVLEGRLSTRESRIHAAWVAVRDDAPDTETIWLDGGADYVRSIPEAYTKAHGSDPAVYWYQSRVIGSALAATGLSVHGAMSRPPTGKSAAVSILVHGKGWNGQAYARQVVLEPPASGGIWEQLLARLHRPGQTRDVDTTVFVSTTYGRSRFYAAREGAKYIRDTTGEDQRLLMMDMEG